MTALVNDQWLEARLIAERRASGADKFDEVWDGVYVMSPLANDEHQYLVKELTIVLGLVIDWPKLGQTRPGTNISDCKDDWTQNYRCPDVAVFLNDTLAENCGSFWFGGPDFAVEVVSPGDKVLEKLPFYAAVKTREVLVVDRDPWALTLFRLCNAELIAAARSTVDNEHVLASDVVPLSFQLCQRDVGSAIRLQHRDQKQEWLIDTDAG